MEEIRRLQAEEFEQNIALFECAFQRELTEQERRERKETFVPQVNWGFFVDDQLAAKLAILPLQMWIQEKSFPMGGISSVATWPEYRRHGMVGRLMANSLEVMRQDGLLVSALAPFSYAFYRKYGWETFMERKKYEIDKRYLPLYQPCEGRIKRVVPSDHLPVLSHLYGTYAKSFNGMLNRDELWWRNQVINHLKGVTVIYSNRQGDPCGYMIYQVSGRIFNVKEMVYLDEEAQAALWHFIANHDTMFDKVTLLAPADDPFSLQLAEPRIQQQLHTAFMARIVDVKPFIELYPFAATGLKHHFRLRVEDQFAPWNQGVFEIEVDQAGIAVANGPIKDESGEVDASCDIQTLSMLLVSCRQARWLKRLGRLQCGEPFAQQLEAIISVRSLFITDGF